MKQCNSCNETKPISEFYKNNTRKIGYQHKCKVCAAEYKKSYNKTKRGHLSSYLSDSRQRAKEKNIPFDLDLEYLESIALNQCPIFKTPFDWGRDSKGQGNERPSLDRIIPELGYVKGNVAFISMWANSIKQDATEKELYLVADWIHERRKDAKKKSASRLSVKNDRESKDDTQHGAVYGDGDRKNSNNANHNRRAV